MGQIVVIRLEDSEITWTNIDTLKLLLPVVQPDTAPRGAPVFVFGKNLAMSFGTVPRTGFHLTLRV